MVYYLILYQLFNCLIIKHKIMLTKEELLPIHVGLLLNIKILRLAND